MIFYVILLIIFALLFAIIDLGNFEYSDDPVIRNLPNSGNNPITYYYMLDKFVAQIIRVYNISLGTYEFASSIYLEPTQNYMFWFIWLLQVTVLQIIFLNFIIAEVTNSYNVIMETLSNTII